MDPDVPDVARSYILVLEDEPLILMDLEDQLRAWNLAPAVVTSTQEQALDAIARIPIAAALIDIHVHGTHTFAVADALIGRGIPFIFASGASEIGVPSNYRGVPFLSKPYDPTELRCALTAAIRDRR